MGPFVYFWILVFLFLTIVGNKGTRKRVAVGIPLLSAPNALDATRRHEFAERLAPGAVAAFHVLFDSRR